MIMKKLTVLLACFMLFALFPARAERPPDDARSLVLDAMEVYSWFVMNPLDVNAEAPALDGALYPVFDDVLARVDVMQALLERCFSADIVQSLWDWGAYTAVNGWLYGYPPDESPLARPVDPDIADARFALTEETDSRRVIIATVYYLYADAPETLEFVSECVDGRWIFTEFPFFW